MTLYIECSKKLLDRMHFDLVINAQSMIQKHTLLTDRGEYIDCLADKELIHLKEQGIV